MIRTKTEVVYDAEIESPDAVSRVSFILGKLLEEGKNIRVVIEETTTRRLEDTDENVRRILVQ